INQVQQLVEQVTRQQQLIEDLYQACTDPVAPSPVTPVPHDLPVRPSFDWTPSATLTYLMPTLDQSTFTSTLVAEERTQLIERYPPIYGFTYKAPAPVPEAARLFSKRQVTEDNTLRNFQYTLSAVLRPLDVLGYMILPLLPADQVERIFATINDIRTLILHTEGMINQARNQLALRAVNPSIHQPTSEYPISSAPSSFFRSSPSARQAMAGIPTPLSLALNTQTILSDNTNHTTTTTPTPTTADPAIPTNSITATASETTTSRWSSPATLASLGEPNHQSLGSFHHQTWFLTPVPPPTPNNLSQQTYHHSNSRTKISSSTGDRRPITQKGHQTSNFWTRIQQHYVYLADAFLHIVVHHQSCHYLRFTWEGQTYQFRTTPFGLSQVPWLFTKLCQPILKWACSQGIRVMAYLDDWLIMELEWLVNIKKSNLQLQQQINHLSYQLNMTTMTAKLPSPKLRDLRRSIHSLLHHPVQTPRWVHSLTMHIKAATIALFLA
ncbi:hypothetical protein INT45_005486, partial [Circinella minor]